jgi:hypothetical protein
MSTTKICPLQSRMIPFQQQDGSPDWYYDPVNCCESSCQFWVEVFTTEGLRHSGCAIALQPQTHEGVFRV